MTCSRSKYLRIWRKRSGYDYSDPLFPDVKERPQSIGLNTGMIMQKNPGVGGVMRQAAIVPE